MEFKKALATICQNRKNDSEITEPFLLYSRLSDLCSSSYGEKQKLLLFYEIDARLHLMKAILKGDEDLYAKHTIVNDLISEGRFCSLLDTVKKALNDPSSILNSLTNTANTTQIKTAKPKQHKAVNTTTAPTAPSYQIRPAVVKRAPQSQKNTSPTTRFSNPTQASADFGYLMLGLVGVTVIILFVLALIFSWGWIFWQWFIGLVFGTILGVLVFTLPFIPTSSPAFLPSLIISSVASVVNFVLCAIFGIDYKILFGCLGVMLTVANILIIFCSIDDPKNKQYPPIFASTTFLNLVFIIVAITWF